MMLTGAQVFYIANVYPETITAEEAEDVDWWKNLSDDDKSYWNSVASVLMKMMTPAPKNLAIRWFPILDAGAWVPWDLVATHEAQAQINHSQSLSALASRGGLAPMELAAILSDRSYRDAERTVRNPFIVILQYYRRWVDKNIKEQ